jgi:putative tRNA adenosine deaminase-associated protein
MLNRPRLEGIGIVSVTFRSTSVRARIGTRRTDLLRREVVGHVPERGFAVAAFRDGPTWRIEPLPPAVLGDLGVLLSALRSQPPEGGPFVLAFVEDEFFVIARLDGRRISLLLSDLTAAVEFPLAEQAMSRLGEDPPADDELDEVWPVGDLELFSDLGLTEDELEDILDDLDALPDEMLDAIVERLGVSEQYARATDAAWAGR